LSRHNDGLKRAGKFKRRMKKLHTESLNEVHVTPKSTQQDEAVKLGVLPAAPFAEVQTFLAMYSQTKHWQNKQPGKNKSMGIQLFSR
jgi:hypothetical protein